MLWGVWVLLTPIVRLLITYLKDLGDLGGLISTVIIGIISTLNLQATRRFMGTYISGV